MRKYKFHGEKLVFSEGLAAFRGGYENRIGFVDIQGNIVIKPKFHDIGYWGGGKGFHEGLCKASYRRRYGFINKDGEVGISPIYKKVQNFSEGLAAVLDNKYLIYYINKDGVKAIDKAYKPLAFLPQQHKFSGDFHEGLAFVPMPTCQRDLGVFIDKSGEYKIEPAFDWRANQHTFFSDGVAIVKRYGPHYYGILDHKGNFLENKRFEYAGKNVEYFRKGEDGIVFKQRRKYGLIDKMANIIVEPIYESIIDFNEKYLIVKLDGQKRLINRADGKTVEYPNVEFKSWFIDGLALVYYNNHFGFIDITGQFIIEPTFTNAHDFSDGVAQVEIDGKWGLINTKGEKIAGF